ncbi:putative ribonuclease H-like domain-containing protein [Tanacetum coccineum]
MYGLHQAPRAWYETLSTYILDNGFPRGKIDKTLFIKRHKVDILLVQVYVDDIIFGSTKKELCIAFKKLMMINFQDEFYGRNYIFLRITNTINSKGITSSDVEKDFLDRKSTIGGCQFLGGRLISWQCKKQTVVANSITEADSKFPKTNCHGMRISGGGPSYQETIGDTIAQTRFESVFKHSNDSLLAREPVKPIKKKDLIKLDEEAALKLQAKFDEEERLPREKAEKEKEANIALIET